MANFNPVIDPNTQKATGLYLNNGTYYKYDPVQGYVPTTDTQPSRPSSSSYGGLQIGADTNGKSGLFTNIYGSNPQDYAGVFNQGYQNLGQPGMGHDAVVANGTHDLASAYIDSVFQKTGSLPSEQDVRGFVADNLTPGFTQKYIQGMPKDQINALANQYVSSNAASPSTAGISGLSNQLDKAFEAGKQNLVSGYDTSVYGPQKTQAVNDLAGQGMLQNPNSRYTLNALDANKSRDLASGLTTLEGARAQGQVGLDTTIQSLLQENANRAQNAYQFGKTYNANQDNTAFNQGLQTRQLSLADTLGKLQANGQSNNGLAGAFGGAATGALAGSAAGGIGAIPGAFLGAAGGYFSTKR